MGLAKDEMMYLDSLGLSGGNRKSVCGECIGDNGLAEFISEESDQNECSYCKKKAETPIACPLMDVVIHMADIIKEEWAHPEEELPYDSGEGGFQGDHFNGYELFWEIGYEPENTELCNDIRDQFDGRRWCRRDYFGLTESERSCFGWDSFCEEVKHNRRYTFWTSYKDGKSEFDPEIIHPAKMLEEIEYVVDELQLIQEFPTNQQFWRAQEHKAQEILPFPDQFTSPPKAFATQPNRMSPGGVPMFYGAEDHETAVLEVSGKNVKMGFEVSGIAFESLRPFNLLDLVSMQEDVSYFSSQGRNWRHRTRFLYYFSRDISKPIKKDKRQHIEYVPTQVFTEHVRFNMSTCDGKPIDGIRYHSSLNKKPCYVLFFDQDDCLKSRPKRPQSLKAVEGSLRTIDLGQVRQQER